MESVNFCVHGLLPVTTKNCNMQKTKYDYSNVQQNKELPHPISFMTGYNIQFPSKDVASTVKEVASEKSANAFKTHPFANADTDEVTLDAGIFDMSVTQFITYVTGSYVGHILNTDDMRKKYTNVVGRNLGKTSSEDPHMTNIITFKGNPCDWPFQWFDLVNVDEINKMLHTRINQVDVKGASFIPPYISSFRYSLCTTKKQFNITEIINSFTILRVRAKVDKRSNNKQVDSSGDTTPCVFTLYLKYNPTDGLWFRPANNEDADALVTLKFSKNRVEVTVTAMSTGNDDFGISKNFDDDGAYGTFGKMVNGQSRKRFKHVEIKSLLSWTYKHINELTSILLQNDNTKYLSEPSASLTCFSHNVRTRHISALKDQKKDAGRIQQILLAQFSEMLQSHIKDDLIHDMTQFQFSQSRTKHSEFGYGFFPMI